MQLIDTHCHLNHEGLLNEAKLAISRAKTVGVEKFIVVGYDLPSSRKAVKQAAQYDPVYASVGIHPHEAETFNEEALAELAELAIQPKVIAFGEIGLDYYRDLSPRPAQHRAFLSQLALANELSLPVIIHCRDAYPEMLSILKQELPALNGGVLHCFSGSEEDAEKALNMGLYLGIAGPITFKNARGLREIVRSLPPDRILTETDAPYLAPDPYRGKRNEPAYVSYVAQKIAEALGIGQGLFAEQAYTNAHNLFKKL